MTTADRDTDGPLAAPRKALTGIVGLDAITGGGLPAGRTTLIEGGPGCGKTVLALQTLVNGANLLGEPGIFVAFEETSARLIANASTFGWDLPSLCRRNLFFLDAMPSPDLLRSGSFDLGGLLAALSAKTREMGARRVVFDALDMVLDLFDDPARARQETYRLHEWLIRHELTALVTAKSGRQRPAEPGLVSLDFLQFMVDCSVSLRHETVESISQRSIRVGKYRGSAFEENAVPLSIGRRGIEVAYGTQNAGKVLAAPSERLSTGVERLDTMLNGGYYRGAGVLLTGAPGTAKTTLAGAFALASCRKGERTLFVTLDSPAEEVVRNLASVDVRLAPFVEDGSLLFKSERSSTASAEIHLMRVREAAEAHGARCVVVDPVSALAKAGNHATARTVIERLIDWSKLEGITLLCTSLLDGDQPENEGSAAQISTLADTWIHLAYVVHSGERNRSLSVIKSRGTSHSNQVRELILDESGISLADVYTAGGAVLMGTLRWEKEMAERQEEAERLMESRRRRVDLEDEATALQTQMETLARELARRRQDIERLDTGEAGILREQGEALAHLRLMRQADAGARRSGGPGSGG